MFSFIDENVGLENTLIVLSADHGSPEVPGYLNELGIQAGYVEPKSWDKQPALSALKKQFGIDKDLIVGYDHPYVYLNRDTIEKNKLNVAQVEKAVATQLIQFEGIAQTISSSSLREGNLPDTPINQAILNNFNPNRSGEIYIVFEPHWFIRDFDGLEVASTHGSPWSYDTTCLLLLEEWIFLLNRWCEGCKRSTSLRLWQHIWASSLLPDQRVCL